MLVARDHLRDDYPFEFATNLIDGFDFDSEHGQTLGELFGRPIEIDVLLQPIQCNFHTRRRLKLLQETLVVLIEQPYVIDAIADHGDAFDAKPESPPTPFLRVVT